MNKYDKNLNMYKMQNQKNGFFYFFLFHISPFIYFQFVKICANQFNN